MGVLRRASRRIDLPTPTPRRHRRGLRLSLGLGWSNQATGRRSGPPFSHSVIHMADDPSIDSRLIRRLGGSELAELRQRMRRHFERHGRDPEKSGFHLTKLSAVEYEALALLIGLPPRATRSVRIEIARFDAALQEAGIANSLQEALESLDAPSSTEQRPRPSCSHAGPASPTVKGFTPHCARGCRDRQPSACSSGCPNKRLGPLTNCCTKRTPSCNACQPWV